MSTKDAAASATSPPAAEEKQKESKHRKEKKDKSDAHERKHGHHKKTKRGEGGEAKSSFTSTPAPSAAAATLADEEEDWDENRAAVERLCAQYPNNVCCDCGESGTRWASVNHGVFVCIRCSGVHRSLGTHVSKVKSTNMDRWSLAEVRLMEAIGNAKGKTLYEARLPAGTRPSLSSSTNSGVADEALKSFIRRKYVEREFAMHNLKDVLGRLYKDTGYGRPPKKPSRAAEAGSAARAEAPVDRAAITGARGDTMRALYGDNAEELQRGASKRKKGGAAAAAEAEAAAAAPKPTYGAFGLVNVPADAYEARWKRTLEVFAYVEPAAAAAEAELEPLKEEEEEDGVAEKEAPADVPVSASTGNEAEKEVEHS